MQAESYAIAISALISLALCDSLFAMFAGTFRKRSYNKAKNIEEQKKIENPNKIYISSHYYTIYAELRSEVQKYHLNAVRIQNKYQGNVTSIGFLLFASLAALFTLVFTESDKASYEFLLWIELFTLVGAYTRYRLSDRTRETWLDNRSESELARMLRSLLPLTISGRSLKIDEIQEYFRKQLSSYFSKYGGSAADYERSAEAILKDALNDLDGSITTSDARAYVHTRIIRQKNWYDTSEKRLEAEAARASFFTKVIYFSTISIAVLKVLTYYFDQFPYQKEVKSIFTAFLFLGVILSGYITYSNFSRLSASLRQIYRRQFEIIVQQLSDIEKESWWLSESTISEKIEIINIEKLKIIVRNFEKLKVDEHVRWISSRRLIEVALG